MNTTRTNTQLTVFANYMAVVVILSSCWILVNLIFKISPSPLWFQIVIPAVHIGLWLLVRQAPAFISYVINIYFAFVLTFLLVRVIEQPADFALSVFWFGILPLLAHLLLSPAQAYSWSAIVFLFLVGTGIYIDLTFPEFIVSVNPHTFVASCILFCIAIISISLVFKIELIRKNKVLAGHNASLTQLQQQLKHNQDKLEDYIKCVHDFSESAPVVNGDFNQSVTLACEVLREQLRVTRVSYWTYVQEENLIRCQYMTPTTESADTVILAKTPRYADELMNKRIIDASDAASDPRTSEFLEGYLIPNQIKSMLDTPVIADAELCGVLCCENKFQVRKWDGKDILFADAISGIVMISNKAELNKKYLNEIEDRNVDLKLLNESLDQKVKQRTKVLQQQNEQLKEYAYINSHLLRAPLSSILGLIQLFEKGRVPEDDNELIAHLKKSGMDLDRIIRRITAALDEGGHFQREAIGPPRSQT